uniref:Reverse transcriptase Ty1/copia-type domain-containing protein n=1 Tax=Fagus sylvatica TaxID=28930 RepID=A0A2N9FX30_FAGSY
MFININVVRWIPVSVSVFLWVILLLRKGTSVIIPILENCLYLWMLPSLNKKHYFPRGASDTSLQGEIGSKEEEKLSWDEMTIPIVSRVEITPPTPSKLPEERELRVYARRKKNQDQDALQDSQTNPTLEQDQLAASPENIEPEVIPELSSPIDTRIESSVSIDSIDPVDDLPIALRRQSRTCQSKYKYPISNYVSSHRLSDSYIAFANHLSSVSTLDNLQNALGNPKWKSAMVEEMEALQKNSTWDLVELPEGKKTVGCKWVFTVKHKADGSVERYKARLVAKGYTQTYGIDYHETFAPVAKINTIRVLLSLAANLDWPLQQFDVKNAFLHGELEEEVYMDLPLGFTTAFDVGKVCKLNKSLYGLKQSPRAWFGKFSQSMKNYGFKQSQADHTLFLKCDRGKLTALIVYVDDMVVTSNDEEGIRRLRDYLAKEFEMKDLGALRYFLGIEVARSRHGIFLSQRKYVLDLLTEIGMLACQPIDTPIEQNHKLGDDHVDQVPTNKERYQRLVGRLIYLSHTRPDLAYAVSVGLMFSKHGHLEVEGYIDADWAGSITDRKSTSGYFTFVGGNLVTWHSKKQNMEELGFNLKKPMYLYCDNKAAISIAHNPVQHDRTKHVEVDRHFIKEKLTEGIISVPFVKSEDQLADILTKAVSSRVLYSTLVKLGIRDIYAPT